MTSPDHSYSYQYFPGLRALPVLVLVRPHYHHHLPWCHYLIMWLWIVYVEEKCGGNFYTGGRVVGARQPRLLLFHHVYIQLDSVRCISYLDDTK